MFTGNGGRQRHADDVFGPEGGDGEFGDEGGIYAAGESDEGAFKAALARVVAQTENERGVDIGELRLAECRCEFWVRRRGRGGGGHGDDALLLGEGRESSGDRAVVRDDDGAAVEDEFVVAADGVAINHRSAELAGRVYHELFTEGALAVVPGTGGEVDHKINALGSEQGDGINAVEAARAEGGVGPYIFANGHADAATRVGYDERGFRGLEVAVLVEHIVSWEEAFTGHVLHAAVETESGGVETTAAGVGGVGDDGADEQRDITNRSGEFGGGGLGIGHEAAAEK